MGLLLTITVVTKILRNDESLSYWLIKHMLAALCAYVICFCAIALIGWLPETDDVRFVGLRKESLISSTVVFILIPLLIILKSQKFIDLRKYMPLCILAILLVLLITVTRSSIALTMIFLTILFIMSLFERNHKSFGAVVSLLLFSVILVFLYQMVDEQILSYAEFIVFRSTDATGNSMSYRLAEVSSEIDILSKNLLMGAGFGIRYTPEYFVDGASVFYGHNFFTSFIARSGFFGIVVFLYLSYAFNFVRSANSGADKFLWLVYLVLLFIFLNVANFSYHIFLIYFGLLSALVRRGHVYD